MVRSEVPGIEPGERVHGFLPMSSHLVVRPERVKPAGFLDGAPHRSRLPRAYNEYARLGPGSAEAGDDLYLALRPLFGLSFFLAGFLKARAYFGARRVVVASASSKAAQGLAFQGAPKEHGSGPPG